MILIVGVVVEDGAVAVEESPQPETAARPTTKADAFSKRLRMAMSFSGLYKALERTFHDTDQPQMAGIRELPFPRLTWAVTGYASCPAA